MSQLPLFAPPTWSVADLTRYLRQLLEDDETLQDVWVQGEISNFSRPASGHLYFTLKDSQASLRCVMWRNNAMRLGFIPRDGTAVEAHGALSIYEAGGQYQLYVDLLRPAGEGALFQEFLRLKARLEAEGLFDPDRKRPIPAWPQRIGIVTSPTGAALRDMLHTLQRRYPLAQVILAPTPVQGVEAPPGIVAALQALNRLAQPDLILVARGGGSIEDLWAFNDEGVARAIAASQAPVISGVGHETDFTIADFAADLRAPTPTAAAELATPNKADLHIGLDELLLRLGRASLAFIADQRWTLSSLHNRLQMQSPRLRLDQDRQQLSSLLHRLGSATAHRMALQRLSLDGVHQRLVALNPLAVLERGFAVVSDANGQTIHHTTQVHPGQALHVRVQDGSFSVRAETPLQAEKTVQTKENGSPTDPNNT